MKRYMLFFVKGMQGKNHWHITGGCMPDTISITKTEETKVKILVCYYQPWPLPKGNIFLPIQAGKAVSGFNLKIQGDDTGDNISEKNATFSEFTAWYWAWKNIKNIYPNIEYIGLAHYRRFFALNEPFEEYTKINKLGIPQMKNYEDLIIQKLENNDIVLAEQASFGYNLQRQYSEWHYASDLNCMKNIIHELSPEYDESFLHFFEHNNRMSLYCLFIARYDFFNAYFEWLFPLLFAAEKRIDVSGYDSHQKRVLAFLAERLLNIYVYHHKLKIIYEPVYYIEGERNIESKINTKTMIKKAIKFIIPYGFMKLWYKKKNMYI
jgi:hypothetical protein